ncbi:hypothetical protein [Nocardiopsis kunsanensis]|uniref:hypothetical protein n=1 Tax=Nocardiopsis kunsanensis TaxID=141693 RepID=UPI000348AD49|nr:hypothetical protein [Nocardiopsis kunsanensis]
MDTGIVVAAVVVAVLIGAGTAYLLWAFVLPARRTARLRERFGEEYDHAVQEHGDTAAAEHDLAARLRERSSTDLRELTDGQRERHTRAWAEIQQGFVDDPAGAVRSARRLSGTIAADLGYPDRGESDGAFERRTKDLSVDHPGAVAGLHRAHAAVRPADVERARTEELRGLLVAYRALVSALLEGGPAREGNTPVCAAAERPAIEHTAGAEWPAGTAEQPTDEEGPASGAGPAER